jgi:hypothetical protein
MDDVAQENNFEEEETQEELKERFVDFLRYLVKRFILSVSFGSGVLGFLWLLGRILRR